MQTFKTFCSEHNIKMDTLSNFDIIDYVKKLKIKYFRGCLMRDELGKKIKTNECGIVNLQNSDEKGSHWCSYYKHGKEKFYFDSYGLDPPNEVLKYLKPSKNSSPLVISTYQIQQFGSVICGQLSIYVLFMLGSGFNFIDIITDLCSIND